ncbi:MAG: PASTA domain-containing protein [Oscillospiraceae bacterium]|nr:PASTA domain-containing protein [Oscillospiraceae bacterium]
MGEFNLCYGCMNPKDCDENGVCRVCGFDENAPSLPSYLAPGVMLRDRYVVGKLLSYNGESANYIGFDTITQSKVVIKEYMPDTLCEREAGKSILDVAPQYVAQYKTLMSEFVELNKTLSKMRSLSHIIPVVDMFGDNNTGYVVLAYFEGVTLEKYIEHNGGRLTWETVRRFFPPIFTTVSLVHNAGLVHRGICPENILIGENGDIKLTGFAISDERTANTEIAPELYSGYAAPEQYNSSARQGTWTDVYGVSAMLYKALTGVTPLDAASRITDDTLETPASLVPEIPESVSNVIMSGMELDGEKRIQTITELVTKLFEQPEIGGAAVRLSSSSTQTIMIPREALQQGQHRSSGGRPAKKKQMSRRGVFIAVMAIMLGIGMFFLLILLFSWGTDNNSDVPEINQISSDTSTGSESELTSMPTLTEMTEKTEASSESKPEENRMLYVMNDITGKNFDIIQRSDNYSSLVFNPIYEYNDEYAKGLIFEQSIEKGDNYEEGTEITVKVSMGPKLVTIPDYISLSKKDYFAMLGELGIKYEEKEIETSDVKEGYVVKLSKDAGETIDVEKGEVLTVFVAKNPPETEPPETTKAKDKEPEQNEDPADTLEPDVFVTFFD